MCVIGFVALWKRKRTLVAFDLFLLGFGFTLFVGLVGFVFILLGGWLLLRAWRLNKYGTTNSKAIASQVRDRPRGRDRKEAAKTAGKSTAKTRGEVGHAQTADREQALHAQVRPPEEDPQTHGIASSCRRRLQPSGSTRRAERRSWSTSARRRTSERAVGSSPSARNTSTSVTMPITVE